MKAHPLDALTPIEMDEPEVAETPTLARRSRTLAARVATLSPDDAMAEFDRLQPEYEAMALATRRRLLGTSLAWTPDEDALAHHGEEGCAALAALGHRLCEHLLRTASMREPRVRQVVARTLHLTGESMKWSVMVAPDTRHDFQSSHTLLVAAIAKAQHRVPLQLVVGGQTPTCTLESLYFRMLMLARFSGGTLNAKQVEILDAWLWMWMPALSGVTVAPAGSALRVDLDSNLGLQRGARASPGPSLYLPQGPIEKAYRTLRSEFQSGRIVPSDGLASTFRIEEHVAVLNVIRRGLRASRAPPAERAPRREHGSMVQLLSGLGEITGGVPSSKEPATLPAASGLLLTLEGGSLAPSTAPAATALDDSYIAKRRMVRLVDESDSGLGFEGSQAECGALVAGDLVALRLADGAPFVPCKVVRSAPSRQPNQVVVGVRRLGSALQPLDARSIESAKAPPQRLLFVAGQERDGRQDAYLVSERAYGESTIFTAEMDGKAFRFKPNRARERGRGWVLAGFEVLAAAQTPVGG